MKIIWCIVPEIKARQTEFFIILSHLAFNLPNNLKNQNFEKLKKMPEDIIILHLHTTNESYDVWFLRYGARQTQFYVILDYFLPKFWKNEKMPIDIIILHMFAINENHTMYVSWDMEHDRHNFFSFLTILYLLLL